jgi:hypothetical protein
MNGGSVISEANTAWNIQHEHTGKPADETGSPLFCRLSGFAQHAVL